MGSVENAKVKAKETSALLPLKELSWKDGHTIFEARMDEFKATQAALDGKCSIYGPPKSNLPVISPKRNYSNQPPVEQDIRLNPKEQALDDQLILEYVPSDKGEAHATQWIKQQPEDYRDFLKKRLERYKNESKKEALLFRLQERCNNLLEDLTIAELELMVTREVPLFGADRGENRFYAKREKADRGLFFHYTTIKIMDHVNQLEEAGFENLLSQSRAKQPEEIMSFVLQQHKVGGKDEAQKVDLGTKFLGDKLICLGPAHPFKVLKVEFFDANNRRGDLKHHGSRITISVLPPEDAKVKPHKLVLVHFTAIYRDIYEEGLKNVKLGIKEKDIKKIFPARTFLGMTRRKIGRMNGPHLHISSDDEEFDRFEMYKLWTGKVSPEKQELMDKEAELERREDR